MKIYGLATCDTCRKAKKAMPSAIFVDVRADVMPVEKLKVAYDAFGDSLLNTRSATWRSLAEDERKGTPVELITKHPLLMKRPVIDNDGTLYLGWTREIQTALSVAE